MLQRLIPAAIGLPILLATLTHVAGQLGLVSATIEGWLFASAVMLAFVAVAVRVAAASDQSGSCESVSGCWQSSLRRSGSRGWDHGLEI